MTEACLSTIVEDDVRGAISLLISRDAPNRPGGDLFCSDRLPVFRDNVPLDRYKTKRSRDAEDGGPTRPVWCTEVADGDAKSVFENGVAFCEFLAYPARRLPGQPGVGHAVVADQVSGGGDGAGDLRALANVAPNEEEAGADIVVGEDLKQALSDNVVRAIVEGEGDFAWIVAGYECLAEELGFRR